MATAIGIALASVIGLAPAARAAPAPRTELVPAAIPAVVVHYDDLNLATEEGVQALYARIVGSAGLICGHPDNRDLAGMSAMRSCRNEAVARAVRAVGDARLDAIHAAVRSTRTRTG